MLDYTFATRYKKNNRKSIIVVMDDEKYDDITTFMETVADADFDECCAAMDAVMKSGEPICYDNGKWAADFMSDVTKIYRSGSDVVRCKVLTKDLRTLFTDFADKKTAFLARQEHIALIAMQGKKE